MEKAEKRRNPYRYEADVLLTGVREWNRRLKTPENYLEGMAEALEPVYSPAYQWFVRFKYMPILSQLEDAGNTCWYDHEFAFGENEVRYMFCTALRKVSEVGSYACALESVEDVRKFMQILYLGQFVRHELISQMEAEDIFQEKDEKVNMLGMRWVSKTRRTRTSYVMPKSHGVSNPERCYEVHTTRLAWTADEINYGRKFWGRRDELEGIPESERANEREESSGKHEVVNSGDKEKRAASGAQAAGRKPEEAAV